jgi:Concanavalin A-like lectin/glucanases superfamily
MPIITKTIANSIIPNNYTNAITFTQKPGLQYHTSAIFPTYIDSVNLLFHLDAGNPASYSGSGSTWNDLAGSGLTTTLYNSPTYSSDNGGYLSFVVVSDPPSSSQYAQTSASLSVLTTWTIEVWHYYNGTFVGGAPCILTEVFSSGAINFFLGTLNGATAPELQVGFFNNNWNVTSGGYTLPANGWYHLVGTYDGSNVKLYVNNVLTQTYATSQTPISSGGGIRFMRRWDQGDYWGGRLAIIKIYDDAISNGDVTTNYNANRARFGL